MHSTWKAQGFRIPHAQDHPNIKTRCPDQSHSCSMHALPLSLIQEGSEEHTAHFWPTNRSKRTQQPMTNYHQPLEQQDKPFLPWGFPPTLASQARLTTTVQSWSHQKAGAAAQRAEHVIYLYIYRSHQIPRSTGNGEPCVIISWRTAFPAI